MKRMADGTGAGKVFKLATDRCAIKPRSKRAFHAEPRMYIRGFFPNALQECSGQ
jgi:hypothetical protein